MLTVYSFWRENVDLLKYLEASMKPLWQRISSDDSKIGPLRLTRGKATSQDQRFGAD